MIRLAANCPFCDGGAEPLEITQIAPTIACRVHCSACGTDGPTSSRPTRAIERWNIYQLPADERAARMAAMDATEPGSVAYWDGETDGGG
jgi:hypothetical protein